MALGHLDKYSGQIEVAHGHLSLMDIGMARPKLQVKGLTQTFIK